MALGFPAIVPNDRSTRASSASILQKLGAVAPLITVVLAGFNIAVIGQEFYRGIAARRRSAPKPRNEEGVFAALLRLVDKSRRRYGGYIVHLGIVLLFLGFLGRAWGIERRPAWPPETRPSASTRSATSAPAWKSTRPSA